MTKKTRKTKELIPESTPPTAEAALENKIEDPIGDETDGEAGTAIEPRLAAVAENEAETEVEAEDGPEPEAVSEPEFTPKPRPPAKLERLQKILAQAGVASRRKAEEMIEQGRVQVNGKTVTVLGTKADAARDHIRVDGKLLQGAERLRYFVLNKPKGFVTTVKDPEGRPTVMQFFSKFNERLYPVGRLDYMSEGLLLMTNDGELANRLTKAASGVEKTYLVKVAGQPTESELAILRGGVAIERGKPGSPQVRTSPARIRQVRQGDNPWYEVVLIEGRNRELRKIFEAVGHFVEKIRRVGYGPLVLDQEPGKIRELTPQELDALRKAAEGNMRTPKSKEIRRRNAMDAAGLPTVAPRPTLHPRPAKPTSVGLRPSAARPAGRPAWQKDNRPARPPSRFTKGPTGEGSPAAGKTYRDRPAAGRSFAARPASKSPAWKNSAPSDSPANKRPFVPRRQAPVRNKDFGPVTPPNLYIEEIQQPDRSNAARPGARRTSSARPISGKSSRGEGGLPRAFTTSSGKPRAGGARPSSKPDKPFGSSYRAGSGSGPRRPFTPRPESATGSRPPNTRKFSGSSPTRGTGPRREGPGGERKTGAGWKPKTRYGGPAKPGSGTRSKPRPGAAPASAAANSSVGWKPSSSANSAYRGKPGGKRPGGAPGGKKRG